MHRFRKTQERDLVSTVNFTHKNIQRFGIRSLLEDYIWTQRHSPISEREGSENKASELAQLINMAIQVLSKAKRQFSIYCVLDLIQDNSGFEPHPEAERQFKILKDFQSKTYKQRRFAIFTMKYIRANAGLGITKDIPNASFLVAGKLFEMADITSTPVPKLYATVPKITFRLLVEGGDYGTYTTTTDLDIQIINNLLFGFEGRHLPSEEELEAPGYMIRLFQTLKVISAMHDLDQRGEHFGVDEIWVYNSMEAKEQDRKEGFRYEEYGDYEIRSQNPSTKYDCYQGPVSESEIFRAIADLYAKAWPAIISSYRRQIRALEKDRYSGYMEPEKAIARVPRHMMFIRDYKKLPHMEEQVAKEKERARLNRKYKSANDQAEEDPIQDFGMEEFAGH